MGGVRKLKHPSTGRMVLFQIFNVEWGNKQHEGFAIPRNAGCTNRRNT